ncbi:MAG: insulinase family protein [Hyphomicrobiales bacterium]|nr:insulinase family protein [Hyphomicrobiales bacterium]
MVAAFAVTSGLVSPAAAMKIDRVVSPGGIEAWVVRDHTLPLIAMEFTILGSADQDPPGKPGVASMATSLLDEGAGPYDAKAFHDRLERKAIELSFRSGREYFRGTLRTLKENTDEAFDLLRMALNEPRFEAEAIDRMRAQSMSRLQRETMSPNDLASRHWWATAFPGHPYGAPVNGTLDSVPRITTDDVRAYVGKVLGRDNLKVAIVGDIELEAVGPLLDRTFGALPAKGELRPVPQVTPQGVGQRIVVQLDVPQAVVNFGGPGIGRDDPDFMAAYIVNHILGGGSFTSRLYREVREKRGLAYGVSDSLLWMNRSAILIGSTATRADATGETIEIIEREIKRLAEEGPTEDELEKAKAYLKGSFALGLDTSNRVASQLVQMQLDNLGPDYIERRPALIDAVTLADTKRVAKRLLNGGLLVTVVGRPEGVTSTAGAGGGATTVPAAAPGAPARR